MAEKRFTRKADLHLSKDGSYVPTDPDSPDAKETTGVSEAGNRKENRQETTRILSKMAKDLQDPAAWAGGSSAGGATSGATAGAPSPTTAAPKTPGVSKVAAPKPAAGPTAPGSTPSRSAGATKTPGATAGTTGPASPFGEQRKAATPEGPQKNPSRSAGGGETASEKRTAERPPGESAQSQKSSGPGAQKETPSDEGLRSSGDFKPTSTGRANTDSRTSADLKDALPTRGAVPGGSLPTKPVSGPGAKPGVSPTVGGASPGTQPSPTAPKSGSVADAIGGSTNTKKGSVGESLIQGALGGSKQLKDEAKERNSQVRWRDDRGSMEKTLDKVQGKTGVDGTGTAASAIAAATGGAAPAPVVEAAMRAKMQKDRQINARRRKVVTVAALAPVLAVIIGFLGPAVTTGAGGAAQKEIVEVEVPDPCVALGTGSGGVDTGTTPVVDTGDASIASFTEAQKGNAAVIIQVGKDKQIPDFGIIIALATAMQESTLNNIDYGDRDSVGLFQQRPSQGWGTVAQIMDPVYSSGKFYDTLVKVAGWESMELTVAAQKVQRSGFPDAYAKHETGARALFANVTGSPSAGGGGTGGCGGAVIGECKALDPAGPEKNLTADALLVARCVSGTFPEFPSSAILGQGERPANPKSDHATGRAVDFMVANYKSPEGVALGDKLAEWLTQHAAELGINYVIWNVKIWVASDPGKGWAPYRHPSGATDDNNLHKNHVHVSVFGTAGTGLVQEGAPGGGGTGVVGGWAFPAKAGAPVTSAFGMRMHPILGYLKLHAGVDLRSVVGDPVYAAAAGVVKLSPMAGSAGNMITITHDPSLKTQYLHLSAFLVQGGQQVAAGDLIGYAGATGGVKGAHLHFEVYINGVPTDPIPFLKSKGVM